jgi:hypothetical protein
MSTNEGMKDLISVINRLHEVFTTTGQSLGLELPQVCTVLVKRMASNLNSIYRSNVEKLSWKSALEEVFKFNSL